MSKLAALASLCLFSAVVAHSDDQETDIVFPNFSTECTESAVAACADPADTSEDTRGTLAGDYEDGEPGLLTCRQLITQTNCVDETFVDDCTSDEDVATMTAFKESLQIECDNVEETLTNPVPLASEDPDDDEAESDDPACFPSQATVQLEAGHRVPMSELRLGDRVLSSPGTFSEVFLFTHRDHHARTEFIKLSTDRGQASLLLSPNHYIRASGTMKPASQVIPGDRVISADGSSVRVTATDRVLAKGLYNPQTEHGEIVVDGVQATCYTTAVAPRLAHFLLRPVFAAYKLGLTGPSTWLASGALAPFNHLLK